MSKTERIHRFMTKVDNIPTPPAVLNLVQEAITNSRVSAAEVTKEIAKDPALTSKLLRIVNSSYFGVSRQVATLSHALVLLGFTQVRNIILTSCTRDLFSNAKECALFPPEQLWKHSLAVAIISKDIARRLEFGQQEEVFVGGLLHDLGKMVLASYYFNDFEKVCQTVQAEGISFREAERKILGIDHTEIGLKVAEQWKLPGPLKEIIVYHHEPAKAPKFMMEVCIVHAANAIARIREIGSGGDPLIPSIDPKAWERMKLSDDKLYSLLREVQELVDNDVLFNELDLW